jgi:hypothetical protein
MTGDPFTTPGRVMPPRVPRPGELLLEFLRASDRAPMSCELRFHGESYGWEAQFLERGELLYGHGGFARRADAIEWAEEERKAIGKGGGDARVIDPLCGLWPDRCGAFRCAYRLAEFASTKALSLASEPCEVPGHKLRLR